MRQQVGILDAIPAKRMFMSIIADYDLSKSICELVDNALDVWTRKRRESSISINVILDDEARTIQVIDNAGGVPPEELRNIVGPGQSGSSPTDETIGIFGVGTKRAVVALAKHVSVTTRHADGKTYQVEFDDSWLQEEDWALPYYQVDAIDTHTTIVNLQNLRVSVGQDQQDMLRRHLSATYAKFLALDDVTLRMNGEPVQPRLFDKWSYPPGYEPRHYYGSIRSPKGREISIDVLAGLSNESSPTSGAYGVYMYCNDRLVAPAMKSYEVGFTRGQAGMPHPKVSLTKVIVALKGDAEEMPWNSSKSDISTKHHVFLAIHDWLVRVVSDYAAVSRALEGKWPTEVFPYKTGAIIDTPIPDFINARRSFLPDPPKSKPRLPERVAKQNELVAQTSPWTVGLFEGVVAAKEIAKLSLKQAHWLSFNLLELTLATAFKEYLVHNRDMDERRLRELLSRTDNGIALLAEAIPLEEGLWRRIELFRTRRDHLFFGRATPTITAAEMSGATDLVSEVLGHLFEIEIEA
ncbi:ATP-binding protein [Rhizobium herbae]